MKRNIEELIEKYQGLINRIYSNMEEFPEHTATLIARKNVYLDIILDLRNILDLHKEDDNESD